MAMQTFRAVLSRGALLSGTEESYFLVAAFFAAFFTVAFFATAFTF